jgi:quercetin dioxygenase-like cupin family protein
MKNLILAGILLFIFSWQGKAQYNPDLTIQPILKSDTNALGQKIVYPSVQNSEVTMLKITLPPGKTTGWHVHDYPVFAYVLQGTLTVEYENHTTMIFQENSSFAEVVHTTHRGTNKGDKDLILLAFYLGEKGKALSEKMEAK